MVTVGEHPNVLNLIAACTETGISQLNLNLDIVIKSSSFMSI